MGTSVDVSFQYFSSWVERFVSSEEFILLDRTAVLVHSLGYSMNRWKIFNAIFYLDFPCVSYQGCEYR